MSPSSPSLRPLPDLPFPLTSLSLLVIKAKPNLCGNCLVIGGSPYARLRLFTLTRFFGRQAMHLSHDARRRAPLVSGCLSSHSHTLIQGNKTHTRTDTHTSWETGVRQGKSVGLRATERERVSPSPSRCLCPCVFFPLSLSLSPNSARLSPRLHVSRTGTHTERAAHTDKARRPRTAFILGTYDCYTRLPRPKFPVSSAEDVALLFPAPVTERLFSPDTQPACLSAAVPAAATAAAAATEPLRPHVKSLVNSTQFLETSL